MREPAATRLSLIPPYFFQELDDLKARTRGDIIDLCEGNPDQPPPPPVRRALVRALELPANHRYPSYAGKPSARHSVAEWYRRRFGVRLNPESEVVMLLGSKEGVAHLIWGVCGPGDTVAVADPVFPMYMNQVRLCGARLVAVPLLEQNSFLPDLGHIDRIGPRIKLLCINFPNNPTAATADSGFYRELVRLAHRHGFFVSNDNVYSELYFSRARPPSILAAPGAKQCCIEFHSLSKTFSVAGWRIGMAVGNPKLVSALLKVKQNTDSGPFGAIQDAAAYALDRAEALSRNTRLLYRRRRDLFCSELARHGWSVPVPEATFYVWTRVPEIEGVTAYDDGRFALDLLRECKVVAAPGSGFGRYGRGYIRFALVQPAPRLCEAARRIGRWLEASRG
ncbi:MAG: aminotransferase class I/II-fold pyridoxal phosphate-dependent enzyme [candidate division WOR-3 bacterium]